MALALAAWIARRITAPATLLTTAATKIAQGTDSALLPVTSADELGQMSAAFNRMTTALHTQRVVRRRLINDLSHELNTPLVAVIRLKAHGLRDGLRTADAASDRIVGEVTTLANLVRDLNWLAETDSGDLRLSRERYPLGPLLDAELQRWKPHARMRRVSLELQTRQVLPTLDGDRMRMSQALGTVVQNARSTPNPAGGSRLPWQRRTRRWRSAWRMTASGSRRPICHACSLASTAPTNRAHAAPGLQAGSIARAIGTAHGGTITVASAGLGRGTPVRISLPSAT